MGIYLCGYSESSVPTATRYEKIRGSNHSVGHLGSYSKGIMSTFPRYTGKGVKLTIHFHPVQTF